MRVLVLGLVLAGCGGGSTADPPIVVGQVADPVVSLDATPAGPVTLLAEPAAAGHLRVGLRNTGTAPVRVATYIATHEWQDDWLSIEIDGRTIEFSDSRDKSAPIYVDLAVGATDWQDVDLVSWAARSINGGTPLRSGAHDLIVHYDSTREDRAWQGTLTARLDGFQVP